MCVTLCCCQSFKWNTQKLIIKNTKWPPRAHWAAMNPELIFKTNCPVFGLISKLWYHRTLKQPKKLSLKCKVSSIIDNVSQKTNPLKEVNQAVLTSCRSESSSFKFAIYCYSVKYLFAPPPFPAAFTAPVHKSCAWVLWLLNKVLLGWPGFTQWPLGRLRGTHVNLEKRDSDKVCNQVAHSPLSCQTKHFTYFSQG